jgi:hypothetical protein
MTVAGVVGAADGMGGIGGPGTVAAAEEGASRGLLTGGGFLLMTSVVLKCAEPIGGLSNVASFKIYRIPD